MVGLFVTGVLVVALLGWSVGGWAYGPEGGRAALSTVGCIGAFLWVGIVGLGSKLCDAPCGDPNFGIWLVVGGVLLLFALGQWATAVHEGQGRFGRSSEDS